MGERANPSEGAKVAGLVCALLVLHCAALAASSDLKSYIVLLKDQAPSEAIQTRSQAEVDQRRSTLVAQHRAVVASAVTEASLSEPSIFYSYTSMTNAFAAQLTESQVEKISSRSDVAGVFEDVLAKPSSTDSFRFLGLDDPKTGAWTKTNGTDVIIGVVDDGIWPEHPSFYDKGYGPVPKKFQGICEAGQNFTKKLCNRKIVGARSFSQGFKKSYGIKDFSSNFSDYASPRSYYGHGVFTSSIAGGSIVEKVAIYNRDFGTAKGIAYSARIASYKVCWFNGYGTSCTASDIIAAVDKAVEDGVDIINLSLTLSSSSSVLQTLFGAVVLNIPIIAPSGNKEGEFEYQGLQNLQPWMLTVAASSIDRTFLSDIILGSGDSFKGKGLSKGLKKISGNYSLVDGPHAYSTSSTPNGAMYCLTNTLSSKKVKNKIVLCRYESYYGMTQQSYNVYKAGGVGVIFYGSTSTPSNVENSIILEFTYVSSSYISFCDGLKIRKYIKSSKNPTATISVGKLTGSKDVEAPVMADFSEKGPTNYLAFIKPDITAPGVNIIGGNSLNPKYSNLPFNKTSEFIIHSGTSYSCAHVTGAVALIKAFHPSWPPSWIYSALITSANVNNNRGKPIKNALGYEASPFDMGGGHLNVTSALNPGLVYAITNKQYSRYHCSQAYANIQDCTLDDLKIIDEKDLNTPSLYLKIIAETTQVTRNLTLVSKPARYNVVVSHAAGASISVTPKTLKFSKSGQTLMFKIRVTPFKNASRALKVGYEMRGFTFGSIVWSDGVHRVAMNVAVSLPSYSDDYYYYY